MIRLSHRQSDNQDVPADRHAIDNSTLQSGDRDIIHKHKAAARLHLKGSNRVRIGEAGIEVPSIHGQTDAI